MPARREWPAAQLARMRKAAEEGVYLSILATRFGIGVSSLRWIAERDGWHLPKGRGPGHKPPPKPKRHAAKKYANLEQDKRREAEARDRALYGPYLSDVQFLRRRDFAIHLERDGIRLGNRLVDPDHLHQVAERERRLMGA